MVKSSSGVTTSSADPWRSDRTSGIPNVHSLGTKFEDQMVSHRGLCDDARSIRGAYDLHVQRLPLSVAHPSLLLSLDGIG